MKHPDLAHLARSWRRQRLQRAVLWSAAMGLGGAASVAWLSVGPAIAVAALLVSGLLLRNRSRWKVTTVDVTDHLDRSHPELEESASLWLRAPESLTVLEQLQLKRLNAGWIQVVATQPCAGFPPGRRLRRPALACSAAAGVFLLAGLHRFESAPEGLPTNLIPAATLRPEAAVSQLRAATLQVAPPEYTLRPSRRIEGLDADVEEGSVVRWDIVVSEDIRSLEISPGPGVPAQVVLAPSEPGRFSGSTAIGETLIYQLSGTRADGSRWFSAGLHALKVVRDHAPRMTFSAPLLSRTILDPADPRLEVRVTVSDDHGVSSLRLIATVAKGSGEGVKFRDVEFPLTPSGDAAPDEWRRTLDAGELGLEPGDELYFHAIATDNRAPAPQSTRTETRFAVLPGEDAKVTDPGVAVAGINLVPEYFRSQRQLIIDTERLIAEQPDLPADTFLEHSDAIGIDQKLLRLRYGQFLGEEFEPEPGGGPAEDEHEHADEGEGGALVESSRASALRPEAVDSIQAQFMHNHDKPEAATFFAESVKASLRQVLAAMWEAEGFLRTGRPADALPAENRALEMLKVLQQADRVYVKRMGFDPPVIRIEERRLKGELDAIPATATSLLTTGEIDPAVTALREALFQLTGAAGLPESVERDAAVSSRLGEAARSEPERYLTALEAWRIPARNRSALEAAVLTRALLSLLPEPVTRPNRGTETAPPVAAAYSDAVSVNPQGAP